MFSPAQNAKLKHFMTWLSLKRLNFNSCVISTGIIELIKGSLILYYVLSLANHLQLGGGGGEAGLLGGKLPPCLPQYVDRTLAGLSEQCE